MADENTISFKLPIGAFSGDVSFGFISFWHHDDVEGTILVYEKAKSSYNFTTPSNFHVNRLEVTDITLIGLLS